MLYVYFRRNGVKFSDFEMDGKVKELKDFHDKHGFDSRDVHMLTSTGNIIEAIRVAVHRGYIPHEYVEFHYPDRIIKVDKDARPINGSFPNTYWDKYLHIMIGINEKLDWEE